MQQSHAIPRNDAAAHQPDPESAGYVRRASFARAFRFDDLSNGQILVNEF